GNVETRLRKLEDGAVDATLLAIAGLNRLGRADAATSILSVETFTPAGGGGAIPICPRPDDGGPRGPPPPHPRPDPWRTPAPQAVLDGSCRTPIGGHAVVSGDAVQFHGVVLRPDGSEAFEARRSGATSDAAALGADAGAAVKAAAPADIFAHE